MQGAIYDLTGHRFGSLTVLGVAGVRGGRVDWRCRCTCGTVVSITHSALIYGQTRHCSDMEIGPAAESPEDRPALRGRPPVAQAGSRERVLARELARVMAREGAPAATEYRWRAKHSDIVAAALAVAEQRTAARVAA